MINLLNKYLCFTLGHYGLELGPYERFCVCCNKAYTELDTEGIDKDIVSAYLDEIDDLYYNMIFTVIGERML